MKIQYFLNKKKKPSHRIKKRKYIYGMQISAIQQLQSNTNSVLHEPLCKCIKQKTKNNNNNNNKVLKHYFASDFAVDTILISQLGVVALY